MSHVILDIQTEDNSGIKLLKREINAMRKAVLKETAEWYLKTQIVPHFGPANRRRFNHANRNAVYSKEIKRRAGQGQGKFVDNVLSGKSRRQAQHLSRISATSKQATLNITVPAYFKKPFVGTFRKTVTDKRGRTRTITKRVTQQPDKVAELLTMDERAKNETRRFAARAMTRQLRALQRQRRITTTKG